MGQPFERSFFQQRIGQYGRPFTIYKFKTLHQQARHISGAFVFLFESAK
ncbi:MAG: sugar transferase [Flavobacterium sp.]